MDTHNWCCRSYEFLLFLFTLFMLALRFCCWVQFCVCACASVCVCQGCIHWWFTPVEPNRLSPSKIQSRTSFFNNHDHTRSSYPPTNTLYTHSISYLPGWHSTHPGKTLVLIIQETPVKTRQMFSRCFHITSRGDEYIKSGNVARGAPCSGLSFIVSLHVILLSLTLITPSSIFSPSHTLPLPLIRLFLSLILLSFPLSIFLFFFPPPHILPLRS